MTSKGSAWILREVYSTEQNGAAAGMSLTSGIISTLKDFVILMRDGAILAIFFMFIFFPGTLNGILVDAGFEEGSFVGFKWKSKLVEYDAIVDDLQESIVNLKEVNGELQTALEASASGIEQTEISRLTQKSEEVSTRVNAALALAEETVTQSASLVENARATVETGPLVRFCYQEYRGATGADSYSVHCHTTIRRCEVARGPNPKYVQTPCAPVNLADAAWSPAKGGWMGSWYEFRSEPFSAPFPQLN